MEARLEYAEYNVASGSTWCALERNGVDHELLIECDDELDEEIVECFVFVKARLFHKIEEVTDELLVHGPHVPRLQPLDSTDFVQDLDCLVSQSNLVYPSPSSIGRLCDLT
jgi:hypothetical protein